MVTGKTIQIFIPDGNPRSLRIADITSRTIEAILIPRSKLDFTLKREEIGNVGLYFLIGSPEDDAKTSLYIGEAEDCSVRLKQQNKSQDFWNIAIVIISKTKNFTKAHVKFLEWYCHNQATKVRRYKIVNSSVPTKPFISEPLEADLCDNFDTIKTLVSTLGYPIFDEIAEPQKKDILICKGKEAVATGEYTEDGLIVFKNSTCNLKESKTAGASVINMRKRLIQANILVRDNNVYKFIDDFIFSSPSAAASTVLARRANGWTEWKYKESGKTLDEVKRKTLM